ncbi:MAG: sugar nucleotide-binding protein [Flavobacteriales bacterium]|nr:sugar nucleotide-binding protein [Flavobacteriales bacterium]
MKVILMTGGSGVIGRELMRVNKNFEIVAPSSKKMDVLNYDQIQQHIDRVQPDIFLHAAALTRPMIQHEEFPEKSVKLNIIGTSNAVLACMKHKVKMVYLSTDYVYPGEDGNYKEEDPLKPSNNYAISKMGGECAVQLYENSLILRACFSGRPFVHEKAFVDAYKSYMYYDEIAPIILKVLEKDLVGVLNIGGERQSVYDFAKLSKKDVGKITINEIGDWVPRDTSMNLDKLNGHLNT